MGFLNQPDWHFPVTMRFLLLAASIGVAFSYPNGAPSCSSSPRHGGGRGSSLAVSLQDLGEGRWQVTVPSSHKGLTLKADISGSWEEPGSGYKTLGSSCITHSNRSNKGRKAFVFRSNSGQKPRISGSLVTGYVKNIQRCDPEPVRHPF